MSDVTPLTADAGGRADAVAADAVDAAGARRRHGRRRLARLCCAPAFLDDGSAAAAAPAPASATKPARSTTLFYVSDDAQLVPVAQDVRTAHEEQAAAIVEAQIAPPVGAMVSAIAPGTALRAVYVGTRGEIYVDLSADASRNHTGGAQNEALAVYAIVNAVTANLPSVTGVQILIEGQEVDTLAGHVDLRQPFRRTLRWVRKAQSQP
jgi:spore germination protein GerM